jgi:heme-degrading monooxygenase HmoA
MYVHLELKTIPGELRDQAVDRLSRLHHLMSESNGFVSAHIWADVSDPLEYMVTRAWVDASAHAAYRASVAAKEFAANRPSVPLWENTAVQEWVSMTPIDSLASGDFLVRLVDTLESTSPGIPYDPLARFRALNHLEAGDRTMTLWRFSGRSKLEPMGPGHTLALRGYELISEIIR